jgi:hypothetical protein
LRKAEERTLGWPRDKREDNIKMDLTEKHSKGP